MNEEDIAEGKKLLAAERAKDDFNSQEYDDWCDWANHYAGTLLDAYAPSNKEPDLGGVRIGVEGGVAWVNPSKIRVLSAAWKDGATGLALVYDDGSPSFTPMDAEEAHRVVTEVRAAWNK